ncbi:hypothetical protein N431DRAFT_563654 [Stipitochalara longipes BDJ]|nr:hypothetical protein N431DRAFT_563654 [Stipitochalara longipes BDJ]
MANTTPDKTSEGGNKRGRDHDTPSPPIKRTKKREDSSAGDEKEQEDDKDSLFGSPTNTAQECYICLEAFHERKGEGKVLQPCGHLFCAECWEHWATWLRQARAEVRCANCRGLVVAVDDWFS